MLWFLSSSSVLYFLCHVISILADYTDIIVIKITMKIIPSSIFWSKFQVLYAAVYFLNVFKKQLLNRYPITMNARVCILSCSTFFLSLNMYLVFHLVHICNFCAVSLVPICRRWIYWLSLNSHTPRITRNRQRARKAPSFTISWCRGCYFR